MRKTILVVDDDISLRETLCDSFDDEGYATVAAANGRDALLHLRAATTLPSLIVLDLMMPIMNGWQFRQEQKVDPLLSVIPVIVMTANCSVDRTSIDIDELILKPVDLETLLATVARYCRP